MDLTHYRTLGRSGLAVSPIALGAMTFGTTRWGTDEAGSRAVFDAYVDPGGNFVDTADVYSAGRSEEMLGRFIADRSLRNRLVIATKSGFSREAGNPNAGGNGAKNIRSALESSLRRLQSDHVDLYYIHVWDMVTPAAEVLETLTSLVHAGKIRYFGLSNVPAWFATQMATLAAARGGPGPIALQMGYSLIERGIENEHVPAARALGLGIVPWAPLAAGFLTGKYTPEAMLNRDTAASGGNDSRLNGPNPFGDRLFTERNWRALDDLRAVAAAIGRAPAEVALAWTLARPGVTTLLLGASRPEHVAANVAALDLVIAPEHLARLDAAGAPDPVALYALFSPPVRRMIFGGSDVTGWTPA